MHPVSHEKSKELPAHLVLFDGDCGLCNRTVRFIWKHDLEARIFYLPLQSERAHAILKTKGVSIPETDTIYFLSGGNLYTRSEATIGILRLLPTKNWIAQLLRLFPAPLRNLGYRIIAKNRHRFFQTQQCALPSKELQKQMLSED